MGVGPAYAASNPGMGDGEASSSEKGVRAPESVYPGFTQCIILPPTQKSLCNLSNDGHLARARRPHATAEHAPLERSQHTNRARRRGAQYSHAPAQSATCRAPPSLSTRTLAPQVAILAFCELHASTRDHGAQRSRAHTYHAAGARIATRPAHGTSLAAACERSGAHATVSTSTLTPGGNAMNTGTGIISCLCATLPACTLFCFPVPGDVH